MAIKYNEELLAKDIRDYMNDNSMSLSRFSKLCGVHVAALSRFLNGRQYISINAVNKISQAIGKKLDGYLSVGVYTNPVSYYNHSVDYEHMSISQLNHLIDKLKKIRDEKIDRKIELQKGKIAILENMKNDQLSNEE